MCIGSNSVNQAQDLMTVTKIKDLPNSLLPTIQIQVVDQEYLHRLGGGGAGEAGGHRQVDGGEGQQAGDVHVDHHLVPVLGRQVERGWGGSHNIADWGVF